MCISHRRDRSKRKKIVGRGKRERERETDRQTDRQRQREKGEGDSRKSQEDSKIHILKLRVKNPIQSYTAQTIMSFPLPLLLVWSLPFSLPKFPPPPPYHVFFFHSGLILPTLSLCNILFDQRICRCHFGKGGRTIPRFASSPSFRFPASICPTPQSQGVGKL